VRGALLAGAALLLGACVPPAPAGGPVPERLAGEVAVVGSAPLNVRTALHTADGRSVWIEGPAAAELRALAGARVEVEGRLEGGVVHAEGYRILAVDGRPVWTGTVEEAPGGGLQLRLEDGSVVRLGGGADRLRPGQKVWVQGPSQVQVQTFGVIAP
jgi:hypothetical protein